LTDAQGVILDVEEIDQARQPREQPDAIIARVRLLASQEVAGPAEELYDAISRMYDEVWERNGPASEVVRRATKLAYQAFGQAARAELGISSFATPP
jgi:hypothetical protein